MTHYRRRATIEQVSHELVTLCRAGQFTDALGRARGLSSAVEAGTRPQRDQRTFDECCPQTRKRGRKVTPAMAAEFPDLSHRDR
jgi:hypothetical protein